MFIFVSCWRRCRLIRSWRISCIPAGPPRRWPRPLWPTSRSGAVRCPQNIRCRASSGSNSSGPCRRGKMSWTCSTAWPLWTPILNRRPTIVTVYDLSFLHYPEVFPRAQRLYLTTQTRRSCQHARRILTISESSRQDVARFFQVPEQRVDVIYPGVDGTFRPHTPAELAAFRQAKGLPERYFLHVGTLQPRKNIPVLLEALALLDRPDIPLYLVGGKGWLYDEIFAQVRALRLEKRVISPIMCLRQSCRSECGCHSSHLSLNLRRVWHACRSGDGLRHSSHRQRRFLDPGGGR